MKRAGQLMIAVASALGIAAAGCQGDVVGYEGEGGRGGGTGATQSSAMTTKTTGNTDSAVSAVSRASGINAIGAGDFGPYGPNLASWLEGVQFSANCQPEIGPSPVSGRIKLRYDTIYTTQVATITVARITAYDTNGNLAGEYPIVFSPASTGEVVPGAAVSVTHEVVGAMGDISGICDHCGEYLGIELTYDNSGGVSAGFSLSCSF